MTEQEIQAPDAGDFDLNAWIDGHHTYPEYTVKVHLDKRAVVESNKLGAEIEKLESDFKALQELAEKAPAGSSLGEESDVIKRYKAVGKELKAKKAERTSILDKAKSSALKVVLRKPEVHDDDEGKKGNAFDQVRRALSEKYPEHAKVLNSGDQDATRDLFTDNVGLAAEQQAMLFHIMIASVTTAQGQALERGPKLTEKGIGNLIKRLDNSDLMRLQTNMNMAMAGADLREEQIDAGFPG